MTADNLALWKAVYRTDPAQVKPITGKSYKGTSPKPYHLIEKATETFGPCGIGWGFQIVSERVEDGSAGDKVHIAHIRVWYVWNGKKGEVEHVGQTMFAGKNKNGPYTDEDAPKKSITDALVKALSMIGFAGDIFMGRYDDSKYVAELAEEIKQEKREASGLNEVAAYVARCKTGIRNHTDPEELRAFWRQEQEGRDIFRLKAGVPEYDDLYATLKAHGKAISAPAHREAAE